MLELYSQRIGCSVERQQNFPGMVRKVKILSNIDFLTLSIYENLVKFVKRSQLKMVRKNVEKGKLGSAIVGLENKR